jgi:hypothetical protein
LLWQLLSTLSAFPRQLRADIWSPTASVILLTLLCVSVPISLQVFVQDGPTDSWKAASVTLTHTFIIRSKQPTQPSCLPFVKLPSMQHIKAGSNSMMTSIKQPFAKLQKLCKGAVAAGYKSETNSKPEAIASRPHSGIGNLLCKFTSWSSSHSSGSSLQRCSSSRSSMDSSSSGSLSNTPTGHSTPQVQSPRESLSSDIMLDLKRDSAYEVDNGSFKIKAFDSMSSMPFDQQHQQEQQEHLQQQGQQEQQEQQEDYEDTHTPLYSSRWQDESDAAELRQLQLEWADQELQAWATASRGWSRNIAGYGPSWGATRQPGATVGSAVVSYAGCSLF